MITSKLSAIVVKGFNYVSMKVPAQYAVNLGIEDRPTWINRRRRKGTVVRFRDAAERAEFIDLASRCGGQAEAL